MHSIRYVVAAVPQYSINKPAAWTQHHFDVMFVGDDWKNTPKWKEFEEPFKAVGGPILYFPYTQGTSSTLINQVLLDLRNPR